MNQIAIRIVALGCFIFLFTERLHAVDAILHNTIDLSIGETQQAQLANNQSVTIKLISVTEHADNLMGAIRRADVHIQVNGTPVTLDAGPYRLPISVAGFQIDCPVTSGYLNRSSEQYWRLYKRARIRIWPAGSSWLPSSTFSYPLRQRWFASYTQMQNEVAGDFPSMTEWIYYHFGFDIFGAEAQSVYAATSGTIVSSGNQVLAGYELHQRVRNRRPDVVNIMDNRGFFWRYSHLGDIESWVVPGAQVQMGQKIANLGKEGPSGGGAHLHFDATALQPSGEWGTEDAYAFLWEAYHQQYPQPVTAVARPHTYIGAGQQATLDASRSAGNGLQFQWTFSEGGSATGAKVTHSYPNPGLFSEIVKVTDAQGNVDYDFASVIVQDPGTVMAMPTIMAAYSPTFGIQAGDLVSFEARTLGDTGGETWDFGDGTPQVFIPSNGQGDEWAANGYGRTTHSFANPGTYLVRVEHVRWDSVRAIARLQVRVGGSVMPSPSINR
jgi:murein DD-endopeptidase MepM/ murein hydrolase activator NlpD